MNRNDSYKEQLKLVRSIRHALDGISSIVGSNDFYGANDTQFLKEIEQLDDILSNINDEYNAFFEETRELDASTLSTEISALQRKYERTNFEKKLTTVVEETDTEPDTYVCSSGNAVWIAIGKPNSRVSINDYTVCSAFEELFEAQ